MRSIVDGILNLLYPEDCLACSTPVHRSQDCGVCEDCWGKVLRLQIPEPWCPSCGMPYLQADVEAIHLCGVCSVELPPFCAARAFGFYTAELARLILAFKFNGRQNLASLFAPLLGSTLLCSWGCGEVDLVIPIPLHQRRMRERGYNQAALLSRALTKLLGLPHSESALTRVRPTPPQVGLSNAERAGNMRQAFRCPRPAQVRGLHILLVDDVMTTGATVRSASEALVQAGARKVSVLTLARTVPGLEF